MTTVGYGDIAPHTAVGQAIASLMMILGYGIIAVPTGIVSAELVQINAEKRSPLKYAPTVSKRDTIQTHSIAGIAAGHCSNSRLPGIEF